MISRDNFYDPPWIKSTMRCINNISLYIICITLLFICYCFFCILHTTPGPFPAAPCHNVIIYCIIMFFEYLYSTLWNEHCALHHSSHQIIKITVSPLTITRVIDILTLYLHFHLDYG